MTSTIDHQYEMESFPAENLPPFQFQKRFGEINWRRLSSIDIDKVVRELDFVTLQENISAVTFCNVDAVGDVDPLFAKLLKLAQYTIEYLLHSQDYLQSIIEGLESKVAANAKSQSNLKLGLNDANSDIDKYKAESKRRKKIIQQQQLLIESGASSFYQCPHCEKAFMNASFLQGHMQRRHPDSTAYIGDVIKHAEQEQKKLNSHIMLLEADLQKDRTAFEDKLRQAEEYKLRWEKKAQEEMDDWKAREEEKWLKQVEEMKGIFSTDIDKLKIKEVKYKETIEELQGKLDGSQSNLGLLQDDYRKEKLKIKNYGTRVISLEESDVDKDHKIHSLYKEIERVKNDSDKRLTDQDRRLASDKRKDSYYFVKNQVSRSSKKKKVEKKPKSIIKEKPPILVTETTAAPDYRENHDEMLEVYRPIVLQLLDDRLNKCGVDPLARGIAKTMLTNKLVVLKKERQQKSKNDPNYYQIRDSIKQELNNRVNEKTSRSSFKKKKRPKSFRKRKPQGSSGYDVHDSYQQPAFSTPLKHDKKTTLRKELEFSTSPKLSEVEANGDRSNERFGSIGDDLSSPWDSDEDKSLKAIAGNTLVPSKDKTGALSDWDDDLDSVDSYNNAKPPQRKGSVRQLATQLDKKLRHQKPPPKGAVGGVAIVKNNDVNPFDMSDDDLFSISSQEGNIPKPSPAPRSTVNRTGGTGSASGTSVWGSDKKASTGGFSSTRNDELLLDDLSD